MSTDPLYNDAAPESPNNCGDYFHEFTVQVDEMQLKHEIKDEVDNESTNGIKQESSGSLLETSLRDYASVPPVKQKFKMCTKEQCLPPSPILLQCPLCDKSFKGGNARYPCLIKHISVSHNQHTNWFQTRFSHLWKF